MRVLTFECAMAEGAVTTVYLAGFLSFHRPVGRRHNALSGRDGKTGERVDLERPNLD
ncbi:MAG: hypothetical protein GX601_19120 [Anaerolineales bacterium]|nr:hypothetical protein [Anaerolineales bacterium]